MVHKSFLIHLFCWFSYRGTYCSQDVAIKVLKPERVNADMQQEFAQEVFIMRFVEGASICPWKLRVKSYLHPPHTWNSLRYLTTLSGPSLLCVKSVPDMSMACPSCIHPISGRPSSLHSIFAITSFFIF